MNASPIARLSSMVTFLVTGIVAAAAPALAQVELVEDVNPGAEGMGVNAFWTFEGAAHGSALYFAAFTATAGTELWVSDGTAIGTGLVENIRTGSESSAPRGFVSTGSGVYFTAATSDDTYDRTLWKTDGTPGGTTSTGIPAGDPVVMGGTVFFQGYDATYGWELWKSAGGVTSRVSDLNPDDGDTTTDGLAVVDLDGTGERLFFFGLTPDGEGGSAYVLCTSDGTGPGTAMVKDIANGATAYVTQEIVAFDGRAFFPASDADGTELWASDGTDPGTVQIKDINPTGMSNPNQLTVVGDQLFFAATTTNDYNHELWVTDGTPAGTQALLVSEDFTVDNLTGYNGKLYFTVTTAESGNELWVSDGTIGGTTLFADLYTGVDGSGDPESSSPRDLTVAAGLLFFSAADTGLHGRELWVSDGTSARTLLVHDLRPGTFYGEVGPRGMTEVGDTLFFFANDGVIGHELYTLPTTDIIGQPSVSDGPESGRTEEAYTYTAAGGVSVRGNSTQFKFHWDDTTDSGWLAAGTTEAEKTWDEEGDYGVWVEAKSDSGSSNGSHPLTVDIDFTEWVSADGDGPTEGFIDNEYQYTITGESSYGHDLEYMIDWGDETGVDWTAFDGEVTLSHTWTDYGEYLIEPRVRCAIHTEDPIPGRDEIWISVVHEEISLPTISGAVSGWTGTEYTFTIGGESNAGHDLQYIIHWGDGSDTGWQPFGEGVASVEVSHTWTVAEAFTVEVGVACIAHEGHDNWATHDITITGEEVSVVSVEGPSSGDLENTIDFTLTGESNQGHDLQYSVDWGDGTSIDWTDFGEGVTSKVLSHAWDYSATMDVGFGVRCKDHHESVEADWHYTQITIEPESIAEISIDGPAAAMVGTSQEFTVTGRSSANHDVEYSINWGDGDVSEYQTIDNLTDTATISHAWATAGDKTITLTVRCYYDIGVSDTRQTSITITATPPETIDSHTLDGPSEGQVGVDLEFTVTGTSSEGHDLEYHFDWGDEFPTDWHSLDNGTDSATTSYHWAQPGEYTVTSSVRCATHNYALSEKTTVVTINPGVPPGWVFGDDFEFGDLEDWSAVVGEAP